MHTSSDQKHSISNLKANGALWRDKWGIPHIKADTEWDAFLLLGYAHAQDRLWQMDMLRRRAVGRWSEWGGAAGIEADKLARRLGGRRAAERDYAALTDEARSMLDAYAAGVNAFIDRGEFPREYSLLGEAPEAWQPWNSIAAMRQIGFLMGSFWLKLFRAMALPAVGPENIGKLRYDDGGIDLLCIPPGAEYGRAVGPTLSKLRPAIEALLASQAADLTGGGSNNWVISGNLSSTGRPILMGDPHRELEVPSMYAQAHVACGTFDAVGLTVPGVPGFPHVAHNENVAWCVTHAFMDIHDLFVERFRDDGAAALFKGQWEPTARWQETIRVRNAGDVSVDIVVTRHGPVIAGNPGDGSALAIQTVQFAETDTSFDCLPRMLKSQSVRELYQAIEGWGIIDHNLVAADVDGHIGHRVRAKVPIRPRENGWLPVPGWTGEYEWGGMIPHEEMPECVDPLNGLVVTANNRVVADDKGHYFCTDCHPPYRARRISELLSAMDRPSIDTMSPIYMDVLSAPALLFKEQLRNHAGKTEKANKLLALLMGWDGHMAAGSKAATVYARLRVAVALVVGQRSGLVDGAASLYSSLLSKDALVKHLWWTVPSLLRAQDEDLLGGLTWSQVFDEALAMLEAVADDEPWSHLHAPSLKHPLASVFPEASHELNMSCGPIGGDNDTVFATGFSAGEDFSTKYSALARTNFDVGAWKNCSWIVFQGASGVPLSRHRGDQNQLWAEGKAIPMLYDWDDIAASSVLTQFQPANSP
ncbi:hypothetical protein B5V02_08910 [Mesorhizobium kowhaii]|uniref:Penicillin acylase family protein n=2 Tax=Mesorhizobium kowhaii TaxID=1300272 RepID=A0A2W7C7J3_9HYPH|nr:hypothetical protein B5V02_08910 [Mesorhizobium kowhaii]